MNITKVSSENTQKHKYISVNQALAETLFLNPEYSTKSPQKITLADLNDNLIGHEYISPSFTLTKKLCDQINEISGDNNSHFEEGVVPGIVQDLLITNKSCIHKALTIE